MIEVLTVQPKQTDKISDQELSEKPHRYIKNRFNTQRKLIDEKLKSVNYVLRIKQEGCGRYLKRFPDSMIEDRMFFEFVSLEQIPEYIGMMQRSFWTHESLTDYMSNEEIHSIPLNERKWGIYQDIRILTLEEYDRQFPVRIGNPRSN